MKQIIKSVNGYEYFAHDKGIYSFYKRDEKGYITIECSKEQLSNGDIEFMTENGMTLGKERIKKTQRKFEINKY